MSQSLYQEAIAEAKQLREVAEKNAKNAIIEAITPRIRQFIEQQLINEADESTDTVDESNFLESVVNEMFTDEDEVTLNEETLESLVSLIGDDSELDGALSQIKSRSVIANALSESLENLSEDDREKLLKIANDLKVKANNLSPDDIVINEDTDTQDFEEYSEMSINETDETLYEVDLDEIAALLEQELAEEDDGPMGELDIVLDDEDLEALGVDDPDALDLDGLDVDVMVSDDLVAAAGDDDAVDDEAVEDAEEDAEEAEDEPELDLDAEDLDEVLEIDLDMLRDEIRNMSLEEAKELTKLKGIKKDMADQFGGKGSGKSGDDFGGGKREGEALSVKMNKLSEAYTSERRKNRSLKNKLNEYRSAVETLREQLTEMNLFNAKLLYVNKLLQNKDVAPSQRKSIIEALDDARSLREVKLLFKSLTESIQKPKGNKRLSESAARRALGSSSKAVQSSASSTRAEAEMGRWAELAGIKNK
tara:strand:+ start:672 stop:2105 length:1434 start_codon:yes stop_codon:yes gene_type:complete